MSTAIQTLKRNAYGFAALLFLGAAMAPAILAPRFVSAAQVTSRSIKMSSSAPSATGVTYEATFTPPTAGTIQGIVIDFSPSSPIPAQGNPSLPAGMVLGTSSPTVTGISGGGSWTAAVTDTTAVRVTHGTGGTASGAVTVSLAGFTNPSDDNKTFYARIFTYDTSAKAAGYTSTNPANVGAPIDSGGVALSTATPINVSATVQESLRFCVYGSAPAYNCVAPVSPNRVAPSLVLGNGGTPNVLDESAVYTDSAWFQISTNAANGAVVNIKSAQTSLTSGGSTIAPVGGALANIVAGQENFGLRAVNGVNPTVGTGTNSGTLTAVPKYNSTTQYALDSTTITGAFGDTIANTNSAPLLNKNMQITFGATASGTTKPGVYTAVYNLIAAPNY